MKQESGEWNVFNNSKYKGNCQCNGKNIYFNEPKLNYSDEDKICPVDHYSLVYLTDISMAMHEFLLRN